MTLQAIKGGRMKFVIAYTPHEGGTAADNLTSAESAQKLLANWVPAGGTIHQWVQRCDGQGGFAVVDNDSAADLMKDLATWSPWLKFQLFPVVDVLDATVVNQEAIEVARSVI
jgi:hypothetical protein